MITAYRQGQICLIAEEFEEAFVSFVNALDETPLALLGLAELFVREGNFLAAIHVLEQAIIHPKQTIFLYHQSKLHIECGDFYMQLDEPGKALNHYQLAEADLGKLRSLSMKISTAEISRNQTAEYTVDILLDSVSERVKKREKKRNNWYKMATESLENGDYVDAVANYSKIIQQNQHEAAAYFGLARSKKRWAESLCTEDLCGTQKASADSACLAEVVIFIQTEQERELYLEADRYFNEGIKRLNNSSVDAKIYLEMGHLQDLRGFFGAGVENYKKACQTPTDFYKFYANLMAKEYNSRRLSVVFRYPCVLEDQGFIDYLTKKYGLNTKSAWYLDYGFMYSRFAVATPEELCSENRKFLAACLRNSAIQCFLLALAYNVDATTRVNIFTQYLDKIKDGLSDFVFKNIFVVLNEEQLINIKRAFIEWIGHDVENKQYVDVRRKCLLIGLEWTDAEFMTAKYCFKLGNAYYACKDLEQAEVMFNACVTKDPDFSEAWQKLAFIEKLRGLRQNERVSSEDNAQLPVEEAKLVSSGSFSTFYPPNQDEKNPGCNLTGLALQSPS